MKRREIYVEQLSFKKGAVHEKPRVKKIVKFKVTVKDCDGKSVAKV